jgi:hypothetical protein
MQGDNLRAMATGVEKLQSASRDIDMLKYIVRWMMPQGEKRG